MLYKILLTIDTPPSKAEISSKIREKLIDNNWKNVGLQKQTWIREIIALDLLSVKFKINSELEILFTNVDVPELSFAYQLSLGDVTVGTLKKPSLIC